MQTIIPLRIRPWKDFTTVRSYSNDESTSGTYAPNVSRESTISVTKTILRTILKKYPNINIPAFASRFMKYNLSSGVIVASSDVSTAVAVAVSHQINVNGLVRQDPVV